MPAVSSALSSGKASSCRQVVACPLALSTPQGVVVKDAPGPEYIGAQNFVESKPGYVFKNGQQGLGFYKDRDRPAPGTQGGYAQSAAARVEGTLRALSGGISNGSSVVMCGYCEPPDLFAGSVAVAAAKQNIEQDIEQEKLLLTVEKPGLFPLALVTQACTCACLMSVSCVLQLCVLVESVGRNALQSRT
jgi:hypothetical protein